MVFSYITNTPITVVELNAQLRPLRAEIQVAMTDYLTKFKKYVVIILADFLLLF